MEYHYDQAVMSSEILLAGQATKDNLNHPGSGTITTTISKDKQVSLSESYSFAKTEGNEIGFR